MKFRYLILLLGFGLNTVWADFSNTSIELHPFYPLDGPFVLEINGDWSNDCHPGEQQPVIREYDGDTVLIEFDIIVLHITCNEVITPFRVLVDMSEVVGTVEGDFSSLEITVRFGGSKFRESVMLDCGPILPCPEPPAEDIKPEEGLFHNAGLHGQGLILARQNQSMAAYPLIYDEFGNSQWLFAAGIINQDVYFADLYELSGGQCLGCPPLEHPLQLDTVGKMTMLMDSQGIIQLKVNHGLFMEYQSLVFGYKIFRVGPAGEQSIIDLEGRWGISENRGTNPPVGDLTEFFPGAFDVVLEDIVTADNQIQTDGQVSYLVSTPTGEILGQLVCKGQTEFDDAANVCEF
jgi:hypothetical protein